MLRTATNVEQLSLKKGSVAGELAVEPVLTVEAWLTQAGVKLRVSSRE